jgi:hypothetical protein
LYRYVTGRHDGTPNTDAADTGVTFRFLGVRYKDIRTTAGAGSWFRDDCSPGAGERRIKAALAETPAQVGLYKLNPVDP